MLKYVKTVTRDELNLALVNSNILVTLINLFIKEINYRFIIIINLLITRKAR